MDLRQLRALVAVADHGTFSAAADALDTVQSNISTHIARLEKELGSVLIDRTLNRLTPEGEAVVRRSRRISSEIDNIGADVAAFRDEIMGDVSLGMIGTSAQWLLPFVLTEVEQRFPDTYLRVTGGTTRTLEPKLSQGELDLALIQQPSRNPDLTVEDLYEEEMVLILPSDHPLASQEDLSIVDLKGVPLLLPSIGSAPRSELDAMARKMGVNLVAKAEIDGVELTVSLATQGQWLALVPVTAAPDKIEDNWRAVHVAGVPVRTVGLAQNRRTILSPPVRAVRQVIFDVVAEQSAKVDGIRKLGRR